MSTIAVEHQPYSQQHSPSTLVTMQQPETAKNVRVFLNGDKFFHGRKFVVNRRHISDFNGFLNQVTMGIKAPFGAVRNIYTPSGGHRVNELQQLQNGMDVVAGGVERFRKLEYRDIGQRRRPPPRRNVFDIARHTQRMNVSARWRKYIKDPCQIYVYGNGDINAPALKLLLIPRTMKTWDLVLQEVTEKISLRTGQAVRKLYDMNFHLLEDPSELENGRYYVAVGTEKLKKYRYGESAVSFQHSPRRTNPALPPIRHKPRPPKEEGPSYTRLHAQRKKVKEQQEEEETTVMGASAATGYRPLRMKKFKPQKPAGAQPTHEGESVFHAKPVKVKRSANRAPQEPEHAPVEESDTVFRGNARQIKAKEVEEDDNTKVDLPIDQVTADTVDEEQVEVLSPTDEERRRRATEEDERRADEKETKPAADESSGFDFGAHDRSADDQIEEDLPIPDEHERVESREENAGDLEDQANKDDRLESPHRRNDPTESDDEVVEDLHVKEEHRDEENAEKENESAAPQPSAAIVDDTQADDVESVTDDESLRSNKQPVEPAATEPAESGRPNAKAPSPGPVVLPEPSQREESPETTDPTQAAEDAISTRSAADDKSSAPPDTAGRSAASTPVPDAPQQDAPSEADATEKLDADQTSDSRAGDSLVPDENRAAEAERSENKTSEENETSESPAPGGAGDEEESTPPGDENSEGAETVDPSTIENAEDAADQVAASESESQNGGAAGLKVADESNDENLFTPSSPRSGTRNDPDNQSNVADDEDAEVGHQERPAHATDGDGELGDRGDVPGTDQVSAHGGRDSEAAVKDSLDESRAAAPESLARPDSNALTNDDEREATATSKSARSIPNGNASGVREVQP